MESPKQQHNPSKGEVKNAKLPYPVLNDKRDLKTILNILTEKEEDLNKKINNTKKSHKETPKTEPQKRESLKALYINLKVQLQKIEKQLDYVNVSLKIKKIEKQRKDRNERDYRKDRHEQLTKKLAKLSEFMREANNNFIASAHSNEPESKSKDAETPTPSHQQLQHQAGLLPTPTSFYQSVPPPNIYPSIYAHLPPPDIIKTQPPPPPPPFLYHPHAMHPTSASAPMVMPQYVPHAAPPPPPPPMPDPKIIEHQKTEMINMNVTVAIAQIAAAAHAAAAITAAAYYPEGATKEELEAAQLATPSISLPNRFELHEAEKTFHDFKSKISRFLGSENVPDKQKKNVVKFTDSLKTLTMAYDDDDDVEEIKIVEPKKDEEIEEEDLSDTELEVAFTSNARALNYVLPSTKACRLQASFLQPPQDLVQVQLQNPYDVFMKFSFRKKNVPQLMPSQISASSLTFMGPASSLSRTRMLSNILYK